MLLLSSFDNLLKNFPSNKARNERPLFYSKPLPNSSRDGVVWVFCLRTRAKDYVKWLSLVKRQAATAAAQRRLIVWFVYFYVTV